jgi:hypothetical protein
MQSSQGLLRTNRLPLPLRNRPPNCSGRVRPSSPSRNAPTPTCRTIRPRCGIRPRRPRLGCGISFPRGTVFLPLVSSSFSLPYRYFRTGLHPEPVIFHHGKSRSRADWDARDRDNHGFGRGFYACNAMLLCSSLGEQVRTSKCSGYQFQTKTSASLTVRPPFKLRVAATLKRNDSSASTVPGVGCNPVSRQ